VLPERAYPKKAKFFAGHAPGRLASGAVEAGDFVDVKKLVLMK